MPMVGFCSCPWLGLALAHGRVMPVPMGGYRRHPLCLPIEEWAAPIKALCLWVAIGHVHWVCLWRDSTHRHYPLMSSSHHQFSCAALQHSAGDRILALQNLAWASLALKTVAVSEEMSRVSCFVQALQELEVKMFCEVEHWPKVSCLTLCLTLQHNLLPL